MTDVDIAYSDPDRKDKTEKEIYHNIEHELFKKLQHAHVVAKLSHNSDHDTEDLGCATWLLYDLITSACKLHLRLTDFASVVPDSVLNSVKETNKKAASILDEWV